MSGLRDGCGVASAEPKAMLCIGGAAVRTARLVDLALLAYKAVMDIVIRRSAAPKRCAA